MSNATKTQFIVGESYSRRSICDYDCVFYIKIVSRTEKTVTAEDSFGGVRRYKIQNYGNHEYIKAGNYSMAGTWSAESICKEEAAESPVTAEELAEAFTGEELAFSVTPLQTPCRAPTRSRNTNSRPTVSPSTAKSPNSFYFF